jgi:arylsulfatase A-like enzyme
MFTGHYPYEIGANATARFDGRFPTLAEVLAGQGYRTGGFVANMFYMGARTGLSRGFQYYDDWPITVPMLVSNSWLARSIGTIIAGRQVTMQAGAWGFKHAAQVNRSFRDWLDDTGDRPFFAYLNYLDAHHPFPVPAPYDTHFSGRLPPPRSWDAMFTANEQKQLTDAYDNAIAYLDSEVDSVFADLDGRGLLDNTVVVIVGDHGEQFGEQRRKAKGHGNSLYAALLDVPLIIYGPNANVPARRIERTISLHDLAATLMDLLQLDDVSPFPGESLARNWEPGEQERRERPAFSELSLENSFVDRGAEWRTWAGHMRSITDGPFHYIANGDGTEEMYDTEADPWEKDDLASSGRYPLDLERLRALLEDFRPLSQPPVVARDD